MKGETFGVGLIGWGLAGRCFHAPFVQVTPGLALRAVVTSRQLDAGLFPGVRVLESAEALLKEPEIDLVIVASPNGLHVPQARAALAAGKHVVVEKPAAETAAALQQLIADARAAGRHLIPFQNRRWDGDFRTVKQLIAAGLLGEILTFQSQWPKYRPRPAERAAWKQAAGPMGGVLYDLGPHLIDQAIHLFGRPAQVFAQVAVQREGGVTDDLMRLDLRFASGVRALLEVDLLNPFPAPRFHVRGRYGAFEKYGLDPQEARLVAGEMPVGADWGRDDPARHGQLRLTGGVAPVIDGSVATEPGDYRLFYAGVARALAGTGPAPVDPADVVWQLRVIEAALASARSGDVVTLPAS